MSRFAKDEASPRRPFREGLQIGAALLLLGATAPGAQASPIRSHAIHATAATQDLGAWTRFLAGGESLWASVHAPPITAPVRQFMAEELASADPTSTPMVQYLEWRRDLDPARFDHYHPQMGPMLQNLEPTLSSVPSPTTSPIPQAQTSGTDTTPTTTPTDTPTSTSNPTPSPAPSPESDTYPPQTQLPVVAPEPSTWTVGLAMLGAVIAWHRRGKRVARA